MVFKLDFTICEAITLQNLLIEVFSLYSTFFFLLSYIKALLLLFRCFLSLIKIIFFFGVCVGISSPVAVHRSPFINIFGKYYFFLPPFGKHCLPLSLSRKRERERERIRNFIRFVLYYIYIILKWLQLNPFSDIKTPFTNVWNFLRSGYDNAGGERQINLT